MRETTNVTCPACGGLLNPAPLDPHDHRPHYCSIICYRHGHHLDNDNDNDTIRLP